MSDKGTTRRESLKYLAAGGIAIAGAARLEALEPTSAGQDPPLSASEALERLKQGNRRFAEGRSRHDHESREWRDRLVVGQHPFAVIVGCSDSRVPPELIFDDGFGDLFVIRNAGNVIAGDVLGSIEYAVAHLDTRLVVVMGHEGCGAVTAALETRETREVEPVDLQGVLRLIDPALSGRDFPHDPEQRVAAAVEANVLWAVKQLQRLQQEQNARIAASATVVGAVYNLKDGSVRFLD